MFDRKSRDYRDELEYEYRRQQHYYSQLRQQFPRPIPISQPKPPSKEDKVNKVMEKYKEAVEDDKKLRMWCAEKTLEFHKSETDTKRLETDMRLLYNFINENGTKIPDNISYV